MASSTEDNSRIAHWSLALRTAEMRGLLLPGSLRKLVTINLEISVSSSRSDIPVGILHS